jgi:membrane-associated phospholipid phosphatase
MKHFIILILLFLCQPSFAQNFDINTLKQTNLNRNKNLDGFFCGVSNTITYTSIGTPLIIYGSGIISKNKKLQQQGINAFISIGLTGASTYVLKHSFNRPRPVVSYPFLTPLENRTQYSFPSGHTSSAFNTATTLSMMRKKWYVVVPSYTYASLVAYSRMHLGVHYPSDVIAGALLGTGCALISYRLNEILQNNKRSKNIYKQFIF